MKSVTSESPVLIGQAGPLNGHKWDIRQELLIGRDETCGVIIQDRQVSRFHARLTATEEGVTLEDLGSKNGTYHNSARLEEPILLQDGDLIQIAMIQNFVYLSSDSTMPLEPGVMQPEVIQPAATSSRRLYLDPQSRRVWVEGKEVDPPLSVPQYRLLEVLYSNYGNVVSRQDLITAIWGNEESAGVSEQALDALIRRLRRRLAEVDMSREYLVTVRGHGLRLENPTARY